MFNYTYYTYNFIFHLFFHFLQRFSASRVSDSEQFKEIALVAFFFIKFKREKQKQHYTTYYTTLNINLIIINRLFGISPG